MKYTKGNLLDLAAEGKFDIIVHGSNCFCTFGSGIAKQIKDRYPKAYLTDQMTEKGDAHKLGKITEAHISGFRNPKSGSGKTLGWNYSFTIVNAYTQYNFGANSQHADYTAIANAFKQIKMLHDMNPQAPCRIGIPKIGAGLAGGDWDTIEQIIDDIGFSDLTCVEFDD